MRRIGVCGAVVVLVCAMGLAQEVEPDWTGELGLAFLATSGNSDTQTLGLDLKFERKPDPWGISFGANFHRAEQEGETTAERYSGFVRGERKLNERWSAFTALSGESDEFAGYDLRGVVEAGASYAALQGPVHTLSLDGGVTWTTEDFIAHDDVDYLGAVLAAKYGWKFSESAAFGQNLTYFPNFDEGDDWRLVSETSLTAALTSRLALKVGYLVRYDNEPVPGFDDTDTTTNVSLVIGL